MWIFWNNQCKSFSNGMYTNLFLRPLSRIVYKRRTVAPSPHTHINWHLECSKNDSSKEMLAEKVYIFHEHKRILIIQRQLWILQMKKNHKIIYNNYETKKHFWNCLFNRLFSRIKKNNYKVILWYQYQPTVYFLKTLLGE